jgi:hypothetical protein
MPKQSRAGQNKRTSIGRIGHLGRKRNPSGTRLVAGRTLLLLVTNQNGGIRKLTPQHSCHLDAFAETAAHVDSSCYLFSQSMAKFDRFNRFAFSLRVVAGRLRPSQAVPAWPRSWADRTPARASLFGTPATLFMRIPTRFESSTARAKWIHTCVIRTVSLRDGNNYDTATGTVTTLMGCRACCLGCGPVYRTRCSVRLTP